MHGARLIVLTFLLSLCLDALARETALDRIINAQQSVLEVPEVARLEDGLDLDTKRVDVGDATLYVEEEVAGVPLILINIPTAVSSHSTMPPRSR